MKKKWLKYVLIVLVVAALLAGGYYGIRAVRKNAAPVKAYPLYMFADSGWNENSTYGFITSSSSEVYRRDTAQVKEIYVIDGAVVHPGDALFCYDTASLNLELNRRANELQIERLRLAKYKEDLARYMTYKPYEPVIPYVPEGLTGNEEVLVSNDQAVSGTGTEEDPYVFYCLPGTRVHLNYLAEVIDNENVLLPSFWTRYIEENEAYQQYLKDLEEYEKALAEYEKAMEEYQKALEEHEKNPELPLPEEPVAPIEPEEVNDPSDDPIAGEKAYYASFVIWGQNGYADMARIFQWTVKGPSMDKGGAASLFGEVKPPFPWEVGSKVRIDGTGLARDFDHEFRFAEGQILRTDPMPCEAEIPESRSYTLDQINEMIRGANSSIRSQQVSIMQAEVNYNRAKAAVTDGIVRTQAEGIVRIPGEYTSIAPGEVFLQVQSGEGYVVQGSISEFDLETIKPGTMVSVMSYMTGMEYSATIRKIADSPSSRDYFSSSQNPNSSSYMFEAVIDAEAEVSPDDWVEIRFIREEGTESFYIPEAFVRSENGQSYVMKYEEGKLKRQAVKTGKKLWGSMIQILGGITVDDAVAFPYGKKVKEGVPCEISEDLSELYGY